jgi:hypothetical protein
MKNEARDKKFSDTPDYYWENGLLVFTETYHKKRGYCCKSGCRHCPYGYKRTKVDKKIKPL